MRSNKVVGLTEKFTFNPKEGIDNPVMVITETADSVSTPKSRLCFLKREEGEAYGFKLRVERGCHGHLIRNVVPGGIAERSGLRDGDRVLEVNNCFVDNVPHSEVSRKMTISGNQLCLLVLDGEEYERAVSQNQDLQILAKTCKEGGCKPPRLCYIAKEPSSGLGISFTPLEGEKGRFSVSLVAGGAAEKAGVCKGDRLVWMNGAMVSHLTHSALTRMMKKCGNHITILVIDSESEKIYNQKRIPILPTMAVTHKLPFRARKLHLISGSEGYGFLLRLEKTPSGRTYHVLREVDRDSPAERAGMRDGEILLEVNEESVESLTHEEIVDRVRLSGKQLILTSITASGLEFYTQLGLSPLLFCDNDDDAAEKTAEVHTSPNKTNGSSSTRLCIVQKGPLGCGFNLGCDPQRPGAFISQVAYGGSGYSAGLVVGDVLIEVNGQNVEEKYLEDIIMLVEKGGSFLSLRVMDRTSYNKITMSDGPNTAVIKKQQEEEKQEEEKQEEEEEYELSVL